MVEEIFHVKATGVKPALAIQALAQTFCVGLLISKDAYRNGFLATKAQFDELMRVCLMMEREMLNKYGVPLSDKLLFGRVPTVSFVSKKED